MECEEAYMFDSSTMLVLAEYKKDPIYDILKCERISNILKAFQLSINNGSEIK